VMNDGAYGSEVHKLRSEGMLEDGAVFGHSDLAGIARGFGLSGKTVRNLDDLPALVDEFASGGGAAVWDSYGRGEIAAIRDYCEADCANTYLLYLRFQMMRCVYTAERYASECALLRALLEKRPEPHWRQFLSLWKS